MVSVPASEVHKDFSKWHQAAKREPVQIVNDGEESAYLVSAETFNQLWSSYRRSLRVSQLDETEMEAILSTEIPAEHAYEIVEDGSGA